VNLNLRILAISDIHGDVSKARNVKDVIREKNPDVLVIAGDLTSFGPASIAADVLDTLGESAKVLAVAGNTDPESVSRLLDSRGCNLHNRSVKIKDDKFGFVGFSGPSAYSVLGDTVLSYEPIHYKMDEIRSCSRRVMVSHIPPIDTKVDQVFSGHHVGSEFLRDVIEGAEPDLVICGHIHEGKGIDRIGNTLIVNPGASCDGYAALIDLKSDDDESDPVVEFIRL